MQGKKKDFKNARIQEKKKIKLNWPYSYKITQPSYEVTSELGGFIIMKVHLASCKQNHLMVVSNGHWFKLVPGVL